VTHCRGTRSLRLERTPTQPSHSEVEFTFRMFAAARIGFVHRAIVHPREWKASATPCVGPRADVPTPVGARQNSLLGRPVSNPQSDWLRQAVIGHGHVRLITHTCCAPRVLDQSHRVAGGCAVEGLHFGPVSERCGNHGHRSAPRRQLSPAARLRRRAGLRESARGVVLRQRSRRIREIGKLMKTQPIPVDLGSAENLWHSLDELRRLATAEGCTPAQFTYAIEVSGRHPVSLQFAQEKPHPS
jgi:hypothetical protein